MHPRPERLVSVIIGIALLSLVFVFPARADVTGGDFQVMVPGVFEHLIDFMVTLDLALFALVGYFAKDRLATSGCIRCLQYLTLLLFSLSSGVSLFYAYFGHLEIAAQLVGGAFDYRHLHDYYFQALTLIIAAIFVAFFISTIFIDNRKKIVTPKEDNA
ncbi:hypothetical protein AiwAL_07040 [Acidiphilium sp. AL]|uniref:Integral membrane protein n=2 Tax=Acidiphilium iwatense TaxID=768198 RepID=A0ABS9DUI5_9PROT|nr:hypothetical protein [Acidiphilium sp. AL]MCF3946357.1 hypothetical protein [Acidiphilium iwatense]MCU4159859.1 hypothetical protein [Acidiphilium sp. AL]